MKGTTLLRLMVIITISIVAAVILRESIVERIYIASRSMEPMFAVDSSWWVDKVTYLVRAPKRGEIVVFESPVAPDKDLVKRVIGLPGEIVELKEKVVIIDAKVLMENYASYRRPDILFKGDSLGPVRVPQGHIFVLGDNRDESGDSRDWKDPLTRERVYFVPLSKIKGRIIK